MAEATKRVLIFIAKILVLTFMILMTNHGLAHIEALLAGKPFVQTITIEVPRPVKGSI